MLPSAHLESLEQEQKDKHRRGPACLAPSSATQLIKQRPALPHGLACNHGMGKSSDPEIARGLEVWACLSGFEGITRVQNGFTRLEFKSLGS